MSIIIIWTIPLIKNINKSIGKVNDQSIKFYINAQ